MLNPLPNFDQFLCVCTIRVQITEVVRSYYNYIIMPWGQNTWAAKSHPYCMCEWGRSAKSHPYCMCEWGRSVCVCVCVCVHNPSPNYWRLLCTVTTTAYDMGEKHISTKVPTKLSASMGMGRGRGDSLSDPLLRWTSLCV